VMTVRILKNLRRGLQSGDVLRNHFEYCKRHKIEEAVQFALREAANTKRGETERRVALDLVRELGTESQLEALLGVASDDFKWKIVEVLAERNNSECRTFLLNILRDSREEKEQLKAAEHLMRLQDLEGMRYYAGWVKRNNKFEEDDLHGSPLGYVRSVEALPLLLDLLKVSYEEIGRGGFYRLDHVILGTLTEIALQSEANYRRVSVEVQKFIETFLGTLKNINRLYIFLDSLEQKYDINRSKEIDIQGAVKKLREISW